MNIKNIIFEPVFFKIVTTNESGNTTFLTLD